MPTPCWCSPNGVSSSSSTQTIWPRPCAPKSLSTGAIASTSTGGHKPVGGCTAWERVLRRRRLLEHSVEALPQQHEDEFDDAFARYVAVLVPPRGDAATCRLRGAGKDPRRFVDRDALDRFGVPGAEANEIGDPFSAAVGDLLTHRGDLRVGRWVSVQEAPHERVRLDELEVVRDARADQLLGRRALDAP